jgi:hypothetical protein
MTRRVGRYTKYETAELLRMFEEGYSVYKICRMLNRSQKSIRNNLIKLGKVDGQITPIRKSNSNKLIIVNKSLSKILWHYTMNSFILICLIFYFVINPQYNIVELILVYFYS